MSYKWNEFSKINEIDDLLKYLNGREYKHSYYYHYTNLCAVNSILKNNEFWLSPICRVNDNRDKEQYGNTKQQKEFFTLCFSTGVNENLPLWYLYSGINGQGGRIRFTKASVKKLINNGVFKLITVKNNVKNKELLTLENEKTMDLQFKDILYYRIDGEKVSLKYNTMTNYNFNELNEKIYPFFLKGLIWYYEKETRLLVHLKGEALKIIQQDPENEYRVSLFYNNAIKKQIHIDLAPEIDNLENGINDYSEIKAKFYDSSKIHLSKYHGEIKMNLCQKCDKKDKIHQYF